jgi:hypothetical protein
VNEIGIMLIERDPYVNSAYIVGEFVFTNNMMLRTRDLMLSSRSIQPGLGQTEKTINDMAIFYIQRTGMNEWGIREVFVGGEGVTFPSTFELRYIDYAPIIPPATLMWTEGLTCELGQKQHSNILNMVLNSYDYWSLTPEALKARLIEKDAYVNSAYIVGSHVFTNNVMLRTRELMLAASSIKPDEPATLEDMTIFYTQRTGMIEWNIRQVFVGGEGITYPTLFRVTHVDHNRVTN